MTTREETLEHRPHRTDKTVKVAIYDPADRYRFMAGQPLLTYEMRIGSTPTITQRPASEGERR